MMSGFSEEWNDVYMNNLQLTSWPWSDLVSLLYRNCGDVIQNKGVVFELGCGIGPNIPFIKSIGLTYYGVDGSATVIDKLHGKYPELKERVFKGDFTKKTCYLELPNVDIIIDRASVTHNDKTSIVETLNNSYDLLKPGGYYVGIDWFSNKHSDFVLGEKGADPNTRKLILKGQFENVGNVHFSDEGHLRDLFSSFDIISLEEKIINTYEPKNNHQFSSWNIVGKKK